MGFFRWTLHGLEVFTLRVSCWNLVGEMLMDLGGGVGSYMACEEFWRFSRLAIVPAISICVLHTCIWNQNDHCFDLERTFGKAQTPKNTGQMSFRYLLRLIRLHVYNTICALRIRRQRYIFVVVCIRIRVNQALADKTYPHSITV